MSRILLTEPVKPAQAIDIHTHGAGGNFYGNSCFEGLTHQLVDLGMAYLSTNNRGAGVYELEKGSISHGVSLEKFADCVLDIDAWIEFAGEGRKALSLEKGSSMGWNSTGGCCLPCFHSSPNLIEQLLITAIFLL